MIAARHPRWQERPLLLVHRKQGAEVTKEEMLTFLSDKIAKWWLPDDVVFVDELPHTATGKVLKTRLRERISRLAGTGVKPAVIARSVATKQSATKIVRARRAREGVALRPDTNGGLA